MKLRPISFQWSNLLICSWAVEPNAIMPLLTPGLIPHCWYGSAYVSLVGLTVSDHRCAGVVLHPRNFRQVNIRSYVEPAQGGPPGVLFIRQFIAHRLTAMAARVHPRNFRQVNIRSYVEPAQGGPPGVLFIRQFIAHRLTAMASSGANRFVSWRLRPTTPAHGMRWNTDGPTDT